MARPAGATSARSILPAAWAGAGALSHGDNVHPLDEERQATNRLADHSGLIPLVKLLLTRPTVDPIALATCRWPWWWTSIAS
ncbi:MAG: hypothetical protein ACYCS7_14345 [Acidimicrobiales bacterium]